jgi:hypothetical protein
MHCWRRKQHRHPWHAQKLRLLIRHITDNARLQPVLSVVCHMCTAAAEEEEEGLQGVTQLLNARLQTAKYQHSKQVLSTAVALACLLLPYHGGSSS